MDILAISCPGFTHGFPQATTAAADTLYELYPDLSRSAGVLAERQIAPVRHRDAQAFEIVEIDPAELVWRQEAASR